EIHELGSLEVGCMKRPARRSAHDPVIGGSGVSNVRTRVARHMAINAAIGRGAPPALTQRNGTTPLPLRFVVAFQAHGVIVRFPVPLRDLNVGIVASNATQLQTPDRALKALALVHL